jgi:hypothetical protein
MRRYAAPVLIALLGCGAFEPPQDVEVRADGPVSVEADQEFQVVLTVKNTGTATKTLVDVDIADEWLAGVVVTKMDPPFTDAFHVPIDNTQSYSLDRPIEPGAELKVVISAYAAHAGDFAGDVDFCIDSGMSCLSYPMRTLVR